MDYMQSLVFTLCLTELVAIGALLALGSLIRSMRNKHKCKHEYDWGNTPEGTIFPKCVHCGKLFKLDKK